MSSILPLIFSFFLIVSCGKHEQSSIGSQGTKDSQQITVDSLSSDILNENISNLIQYEAAGGNLEAELKNGRTLLTEACYWMKFKVIAFLVDKKVNLSTKDRSGKSALDYAEEDIGIKRSLFPELVVEQKRNLFLAAKKNNLMIMKKNLEEKPPLNFILTKAEIGEELEGSEGETFLTFCVKAKLENVLRLIAQPKFDLDVNQKNLFNETPLRIAKDLGFKNIEKLIIKLGALE